MQNYVEQVKAGREDLYRLCDELRIRYWRSAANFVLIQISSTLSNLSRKCEDRASRFQTEHRTQVVRDAFESPYLRKQKCHISQMHLESPFARLGPNHRAFGPCNIFQAPVSTSEDVLEKWRLSCQTVFNYRGESPPRTSSHSQLHKGAICIALLFHSPQSAYWGSALRYRSQP